MKKLAGMLCLTMILSFGTAPAFAAKRGTPEYEKLKEYKKTQRQAEAAAAKGPREKGFWQREAERSGFAGTGAMIGNAVTGLVPLDKPNSRKCAK